MKRREQKRIEKELGDMREKNKDPEVPVTADAVNGNVYNWLGQVKGPEGTPYEGGTFDIDVTIPDDYPYSPPKMKFATKIWHPNVSSQTGAICLDILKNEWSPALSIRTALLSIQALLSSPEPKDPQDAEVAKMFMSNQAEFQATAKYWTETFARPVEANSNDGDAPVDEHAEVVKQITDMGFSADQARIALSTHGWDPQRALEVLLG